MTDAVALRDSLAFEIARWFPAKTPLQATTDADVVIAAIELPTAGVIPISHHPLVKWVADQFIVHWPAASAALVAAGISGPPVGILTPDLTMEVGRVGTNWGYNLGDYGTITPDKLTDGNAITRVRVKANGQVQFRVQGLYPADAFRAMLLVGHGPILFTATATHTQPGGVNTQWQWDGTTVQIFEGDTIAVNFA